MSAPTGLAGLTSAPDAEGWHVLKKRDTGGFIDIYGTVHARREGDRFARLRLDTHDGLSNIVGSVHGGYLLAVVDQALFVGAAICEVPAFGGATVDVSSQFLAPVVVGPPIEVVTELLRETGRMFFMRGLIEQEGAAKLAFAGTVRKPS